MPPHSSLLRVGAFDVGPSPRSHRHGAFSAEPSHGTNIGPFVHDLRPGPLFRTFIRDLHSGPSFGPSSGPSLAGLRQDLLQPAFIGRPSPAGLRWDLHLSAFIGRPSPAGLHRDLLLPAFVRRPSSAGSSSAHLLRSGLCREKVHPLHSLILWSLWDPLLSRS